jgi:hypothetical protein
LRPRVFPRGIFLYTRSSGRGTVTAHLAFVLALRLALTLAVTVMLQ